MVQKVADEIRRSILQGTVAEGRSLPRLDDLAEAFGTSKLTIREALRVLEIEGFVSVQRGNIGGAVAHLPSTEDAAYALSLVFEGQNVTLAELAESVEQLEPLCAQLCAERPDRADAVLPLLIASQSRLADAISRGDGETAGAAAREWHDCLVRRCGNPATSHTVGAVEAVWVAQARAIASAESAQGVDLSDVLMRRTYIEHAEIQQLIASGEGASAAKALKAHLHVSRPGAAIVVYSPNHAQPASRVNAAAIRARF